jgi:UDP-N-acetylmuramoylalanine--D-glutamate ligase
MAFSVDGQHVVVAGAGQSGIAAAELLISKGALVTLADTAASIDGARTLRNLGVQIELGPHRADLFAKADLVVLSPGVSPHQDAVRAARTAGVPVIGEIELASRWIEGRVIAITGTKGKSTTTTLTALMLREAGLPAVAGGNLGPALSSQVATSTADTIHVVEVSSFQLETTDTFHPSIAVVLNLSPDHLDRHASFEEYRAAKARIFTNQTADDWAVINAGDPAAVSLAAGTRAARFDYALDAPMLSQRDLEVDGVTIDGDAIVRRTRGASSPLLPVAAVRLPGRHLLSDVLAAAAVCCLAGVPAPAMARAVSQFTGLEHALETVAEVGGVRFVNDSKATNIASARQSIESFERGVVAIMGGRFKGGRFEDLRASVPGRVAAIVAIGEARPLIHAALGDLVSVHDAATMSEAVSRAFASAAPGGCVLLAPACSSFDMFQDYRARGRAFTAEARRLEAEGTARVE